MLPLALLLFSALQPTLAFIGMSIEMYKPPCAHACRDMIASAMLDCSNITTDSHHDDMIMRRDMPGSIAKRHGHDDPATPACRAGSLPFLTSLAYCIDERCSGVLASEIEGFWEQYAAGGVMYNPVLPHYTYAESLAQVGEAPKEMFDPDVVVTTTVLTDEEAWWDDMRTIDNFAANEARHALYAVIILVIGIGLPILATLLTLLAPGLILKAKAFIIYPAFFNKHNRSIWHWFHLPTYGQTIYISLFFLLNVLLTCINITSIQPNTWFASLRQEITSYIAARTGIIAMALAPLTFLFAGRNNLLLWLTNWNHGTYLLLHRWIARIFTLHVIIHSIGELWVYVDNGSYAAEPPLPYWIWGCVATVAAVAMCVKSIFRGWKYELFLLLHIILAVFVLAGTWYHLIYRFDYRWGYHWMLYACFAVWAFDRVSRVVLLARNGYVTAHLTPLGGITRVDVQGVNWDGPGRHGYVYFPWVRRWAPWESHPFSVVPSYLLARVSSPTASVDGHLDGALTPKEALATPAIPTLSSPRSDCGITFYVKSHSGLTRSLHALALAGTGSTKCLIEGPYGHTSVPACDRLILIAGGVGITATLPFLDAHHNTKLYWSVKAHSQPLVDDIAGSVILSGKEHEIRTTRFDVRELVHAEVHATKGETLGVVVCGPPGMCDDVRQAVVEFGQRGKKIELRVEAFSW